MSAVFVCPRPRTAAEKRTFADACLFNDLFMPPAGGAIGQPQLECAAPRLDVYDTTLDQEFELDRPVIAALLPQIAQHDPEGAAALLGAANPPPRALSAAEADVWLDKTLAALGDSITGGGNWPGNLAAGVETALREAWRRQARDGFSKLLQGGVGSVRLGQHVTVEARRIGKGGELRKGAKLIVKVRGLPMRVVRQLPAAFVPKAGARWGTMMVGARTVQQLEQAQVAVASARVQANPWMRALGKGGGAMLAFGPSAGIDFYNAYTTKSGASAVAKDMAVRSAKSQIGNALGWGLGLTAVALVGAAGAPAVVLALGVGIVVQTAWNVAGGGEWAGAAVEDWLK